MDIKLYWYKLRTTPPQKLAKRLLSRTGQAVQKKAARAADRLFDTRRGGRMEGEAQLLLDGNALDLAEIDLRAAQELVKMWTAHRFDLLGSGWVRCGFLDNAPGWEGYRYPALCLKSDADGAFLENVLAKRSLAESRRLWRLIDNTDYQAIDWQKDCKSGYRWSAKAWYLDQRWAERPGGDIKLPWELSRLQHLPRMAVFSLLLPERRTVLYREFRNQCLDFFAQNPPRMGVNWYCTMDVAIRTANLAVAYSIFATSGVKIDKEFKAAFLCAVYEHCRHIYRNLEWSEVLTSNHYLSDVVGLLFGAAFLPESAERNGWLTFASEQVQNELIKQFHEEGSNFEGSVAYHRLSADLAAYSAALLLRLNKGTLADGIAERLFGAEKFLRMVTRPDGSFAQIGDNDSGMLFRLSPTGEMRTADTAKSLYVSLAGYCPEMPGEAYCDENLNDADPTISALGALFGVTGEQGCALETSLVRSLCAGKTLSCTWNAPRIQTVAADCAVLAYERRSSIPVPGDDLQRDLRREAFPSFGLYLFRSKRLYLLINAADNGQNGNGGHAHNDKLSYELFLDGKMLCEDPGTYVYTASSALRNEYRSVRAHNTIDAGIEQNEYLNLFAMKRQSVCRLLSFTDTSISVEATYRGVTHRRDITIERDRIDVHDRCSVPFVYPEQKQKLTAGYGKLLRGEWTVYPK